MIVLSQLSSPSPYYYGSDGATLLYILSVNQGIQMSRKHSFDGAQVSRQQRAANRRFEHGVAAVEMAIILPFLVLMLALALLFGRAFWHYNAIQKAAHDSARYISSVSRYDMQGIPRATASAAVAYAIVDEEMGDLNYESTPWSVTVRCDETVCDGLTVPRMIRVIIRLQMANDIMGDLTYAFFGDGLVMTADVSMPYVGS